MTGAPAAFCRGSRLRAFAVTAGRTLGGGPVTQTRRFVMKKSYPWIVLIILAIGTAILYYSNMIFAVRAVDTLAKFQINEGQLAAISTVGCLPGAFLSILVGRVLDQKGVKKFVALGLVLTAVCMIYRVFATTYMELLLATVLIGVFLLPITIVGPKMVGGLFQPEQMPLAMGIFGAAGGMGTTLAFATGNAFPSLETAFAGVSALGVVLLLSWVLVVKEPASSAPAGGAAEAPKSELGRVLKSANMWKVMFCSGFAVGASLLINTYLTQAFILEKGVEPAVASAIGTTLNCCLIIGGILSGAVIGRLGLINLPYAFICIVGAACYMAAYLLPYSGLTFVLVALAGLICSGSVGVSFTRIPLLPMTGDFGPESIGTATGMNQTALGIMSFALPTIIATIAGSNYMLVFTVAVVFLVLCGLVGLTIPELGEKGRLAKTK